MKAKRVKKLIPSREVPRVVGRGKRAKVVWLKELAYEKVELEVEFEPNEVIDGIVRPAKHDIFVDVTEGRSRTVQHKVKNVRDAPIGHLLEQHGTRTAKGAAIESRIIPVYKYLVLHESGERGWLESSESLNEIRKQFFPRVVLRAGIAHWIQPDGTILTKPERLADDLGLIKGAFCGTHYAPVRFEKTGKRKKFPRFVAYCTHHNHPIQKGEAIEVWQPDNEWYEQEHERAEQRIKEMHDNLAEKVAPIYFQNVNE
jgi:hypothetical protein